MAITSGILLDTHNWIWLIMGELVSDGKVQKTMEAAAIADKVFLCSISLLEVANAFRRDKVNIGIPLGIWFQSALRSPGVRLIDITSEIAFDTMSLPTAFHGDSGDRIIAATARVNGLTLCTHVALASRA